MIKPICLFFLATFFTNSAFSQGKFEITGTVPKEYDGATIQISYYSNGKSIVSSIAEKRKFILTGTINNQYEHVQFSVRTNGKERSIYSSFFINAGKMQVLVDSFNYEKSISNIRFINIPFIEEEKRYQAFVAPARERSSLAYNLWDNAAKGYLKRLNADSLKAAYYVEKRKELLATVDYIKNHPSDYISLYHFNEKLLPATLIEPDSLLAIYNLFDKEVKLMSFGKIVYEAVMRKQAIVLTQVMPDFNFKTTAGNTLNLASLRGKKNVLLIFWASWCGPCIRNIPFLKEVEMLYKNKALQLISVSVDEDHTAWLNGVKKHNMPWLQTVDQPAYISGTRVSELYQIKFIPQYFLIDKNGKLIYHNVLSKDQENHEVLTSLLDKI